MLKEWYYTQQDSSKWREFVLVVNKIKVFTVNNKNLNLANYWRKFPPLTAILLGVVPFFKHMQYCRVDSKLGYI